MQYLPFFPLETVVFEGEELHLHIFEPRYRQLIAEAVRDDSAFGIPVLIGGKLEGSGTEMIVEQVVHTYENGTSDIICRGLRRFTISDYMPATGDKLYASGLVTYLPWYDAEDKELKLRIQDLLEELYTITSADRSKLPENLDDMTRWIHKCGLSLEQEAECAGFTAMADRQQYLVTHLKNLIAAMSRVDKMKELIRLNGHFKKFSQTP